MTRLSVNVNKVATLRNSRGGAQPSVVEATRVCLAAGAGGITVHRREDERHIRSSDVHEIAALLATPREQQGVEYNIEGDPRPEWISLVRAVRPDQATLVPVTPGEITSNAGWSVATDDTAMRRTVAELKREGIRVSVFVDARVPSVEWAARVGADRVELYTQPFAEAFASGAAAARPVFADHVAAAERAHALGLGVNAGHDLDLDNLTLYRTLPHLAEVSIGHALISRALFVGLDRTVREYVRVLRGEALS
jgi:pyridoxine 5-phosphate synthase